MEDKSKNVKLCDDPECEFNFPYRREHHHVVTANGVYTKFIVAKPKPEVRQYGDDYLKN